MTAVRKTTTMRELAESALNKHRARIYRYFRWKWPRSEDLDDLAHELYLKLRRLNPDRIVEEPLAYLYKVAYSVLVNWAKRERRRREHVKVDSEAVENWANNLDNALPDDMAERLNLKRQIEQALLEEFPPRMAQVLELHYREWPNKKIAEHLGLKVESVEKYVIRGTARMIQLRWDI